MKKYYYQIKAKNWEYDNVKGKRAEYECGWGTWQFPPVISDIIEAESVDEAKQKINELYDKTFQTRILKKDLKSNEFLLWIKEVDENDHSTDQVFTLRECPVCGKKFTLLSKYQWNNPGGGRYYCSKECQSENSINEKEHIAFHDMKHSPVIYKITNKNNGMCYIGQTTQPFTLRWYQHMFQPSDTKFHKEIKANSAISDWTFEIIEVLKFKREDSTAERKKQLNERENHWIKFYNSVEGGYNSIGETNGNSK